MVFPIIIYNKVQENKNGEALKKMKKTSNENLLPQKNLHKQNTVNVNERF